MFVRDTPRQRSACHYGWSGVDENLFANGLCLPSGSDMSDEQQDEVIEHFKEPLA